jgi:hypothetical protein
MKTIAFCDDKASTCSDPLMVNFCFRAPLFYCFQCFMIVYHEASTLINGNAATKVTI